LKGSILDALKYKVMLKYCRKKGWDEREIPKKSTLKKLSLSEEVNELE
jgi:aldehyde:ferredoxin oxidoreductase